MGLSLALFNDITNRKLVRGFLEPAAFILPEVSDQDDIFVPLTIYKLNPGGGPQAPFEVVPPTGIAPTLVIGTMTTAGVITVLAQVTLADISGDVISGNLNLNTTAMATAMTGVTYVDATFCVFLVDADGQDLTFQGPIRIKKSLYRSGTAATIPVGTYLTAEQLAAIYVPYVLPPGKTITLTNEENLKQVVLGCANGSGDFTADTFDI